VRLITQYNRISRLLVLGQEFQDLIALASVSVARSASPGGAQASSGWLCFALQISRLRYEP
jgi:hypothetical protein